MDAFLYSKTSLGAPIVEWSSSSFSTHGAHAGRLLRHAHALHDGRRVTFLAGLDQFLGTTHPTEDQYETLLTGGLCEALVDCALDKELYENFNSKVKKMEYLLLIFSCLMALMDHSVTALVRPTKRALSTPSGRSIC
ncbi:hypothetical protein PHLGIDRAFT_116742 [Phlebiopsis gigantea 11061_1 CR5-6]|uniref:Uncharacterized protein n=1 Tax=Phlebiopsis gigantea (strain 11061_1 CR5-6) TaxID=745531 RepID=A0A0C3S1K8_PHLG1|nr:hypothetical protein PHLGIDRAFT_116742 [Phlebiopsis gigantea 11061_1 CR5-6]